MAFSDRLTTSISAGGATLRQTKTFTNTGRVGFSEEIAAGATDTQVNISIDISALTYLAIQANGGDVTVKTNDAGTPADTFTLTDGELILYDAGNAAIFPNFLTTDVTAVFISNAGAEAVTVECVGLQDATP